eukprot:COSAG04_NODE_3725_length_2581_cov_11.469030_3_plen_23_part_01
MRQRREDDEDLAYYLAHSPACGQ